MSVRQGNYRRKDGSRGKRYIVDIVFEHSDGRIERLRKVSPVQTRRGAELYERDLRQAMLEGRKEPVLLKVFASEFMKTYVNVNNKPSERKSKEAILRLHLLPTFGHLDLREINESLIDRFKAKQLESGCSPKSVNNHLEVLRTLFSVAERWGRVVKTPKVKLLPKVQSKWIFLDFEECQRLLTAAETEPKWWSMLAVAVNTGLRLGELLALQWTDIDLVAKRLHVRRSNWQGHIGSPKSGKDRVIPLNQVAVDALNKQRHLLGKWVWCFENGSHLDKNILASTLERLCRKAGIQKIGWHVLRHTFASHLAMRGVSLAAIKELLGHASIEMTLRYAHLTSDSKQEAVNALCKVSNLQSYGNLTA